MDVGCAISPAESTEGCAHGTGDSSVGDTVACSGVSGEDVAPETRESR